ncbi:MAG: hypothetical protein ACTS1X_04970 [Parasphingopyxis sp.]|uniref:hypothetical protein n=1 Tax=Parasphingopyxis sp. TaxID=1920299 RepID=UPI003FA0D9C8
MTDDGHPETMTEPPESAKAETARHSYYVGALLCVVAYFLFLFAIHALFGIEEPGGDVAAAHGGVTRSGGFWWSIIVALVIICGLFWLLHAPVPIGGRDIVQRLEEKSPALVLALFVPLVAIVLIAAIFLVDRQAPEPAPASVYALALPIADAPTDDPVSGEESTATANNVATLFWRVDPMLAPPDSGVFKMLLAAFLILLLGLFYPRLDSDRDDVKTMFQKIVLPAFGLFTFGVGAAENAEAQQTRQNIELIERALPPVAGGDDPPLPFHYIDARRLTPVDLRRIETALNELAKDLPRTEDLVTRIQLDNTIQQLRSGLRNDGLRLTNLNMENNVALNQQLVDSLNENADAIDQLVSHIAQIEGDSASLFPAIARRFNQLSSEQKVTACILANHFHELTASTRHAVTHADRRAERDFFSRVWIGLIGEDRSDNYEARKAESGRAAGEINQMCDDGGIAS